MCLFSRPFEPASYYKEPGAVYKVTYHDEENKILTASYYAYGREDAKRLFNSEQKPGEVIIKIDQEDD